ncbi:MAG: hypothetical protein GY820_25590, partial [Gammaproteobacteria bacterium]|nr:hypothetical protein [Gammaproteobacteria bacterium]
MDTKMQQFENGVNDRLQKTIEDMNRRWEERLHNGANSVQNNAGPNFGNGNGETDQAGTSSAGQQRMDGQNPTTGQSNGPQFSPNGLNSPHCSAGGHSNSRGWPNNRGRSNSRGGMPRNEFWNSNHPQSQDGRGQIDQMSATGQSNQFRPMGHHVVMSNSNDRQSALNAAGQLSASQQPPQNQGRPPLNHSDPDSADGDDEGDGYANFQERQRQTNEPNQNPQPQNGHNGNQG